LLAAARWSFGGPVGATEGGLPFACEAPGGVARWSFAEPGDGLPLDGEAAGGR
jgi:hypothetical protein